MEATATIARAEVSALWVVKTRDTPARTMTAFVPANTEAAQTRAHAPKTVRPSRTTPTSVSTTAPPTLNDTFALTERTAARLANTVACSAATVNAPASTEVLSALVLVPTAGSPTPQVKHAAMEQAFTPVRRQEPGRQRPLAPMVATTTLPPR